METGEVIHEKVFMSPRPLRTKSLKRGLLHWVRTVSSTARKCSQTNRDIQIMMEHWDPLSLDNSKLFVTNVKGRLHGTSIWGDLESHIQNRSTTRYCRVIWEIRARNNGFEGTLTDQVSWTDPEFRDISTRTWSNSKKSVSRWTRSRRKISPDHMTQCREYFRYWNQGNCWICICSTSLERKSKTGEKSFWLQRCVDSSTVSQFKNYWTKKGRTHDEFYSGKSQQCHTSSSSVHHCHVLWEIRAMKYAIPKWSCMSVSKRKIHEWPELQLERHGKWRGDRCPDGQVFSQGSQTCRFSQIEWRKMSIVETKRNEWSLTADGSLLQPKEGACETVDAISQKTKHTCVRPEPFEMFNEYLLKLVGW